MKTQLRIVLLLAAVTLAASLQQAAAIVGFVNHTFPIGYSMFGNPLDAANNLNSIIPTAPAGATVYLWDDPLQQYTSSSTFNGTSWSTDFTLAPGTAAVMYAPSPFLNTYVGTVLDADGGPYDGFTVNLPPAYPLITGYHLATSRIPFSGSAFGGYSLFEIIFGRLPEDGLTFYRWNTPTQTYLQPLIAFGGVWYANDLVTPEDPFLNVGEAGFFGQGIVPVIPEPGSMTIFALGALMCLATNHSRRRQTGR
jgi:hypothetical protein